ncbi:hypothetical protein DRJ17_01650 [Candidatus Woesearchaeota archaeon]|nr:MAG: hypothetical protein DRJ17_01650 [Candidatus Woesearchaeota archaeon]
MMRCVWLIRYGEISLKGKNRTYFEHKLTLNIKRCLKANNVKSEVRRVRNRILVKSDEDCSFLKNVFGIVSLSKAIVTDANLNEMEKAIELILPNSKQTFRVTTKKLDKSFNLSSTEVCAKLGDYICEKSKAKVNLKRFNVEVCVEIFNGKAYLFNNKIKAAGGLPIGVEGKALALIENKESIRAALSVMKRGVAVIPVALKQKNISELKKFSCGMRIDLEFISDLNELDEKAAERGAKALVVSDKVNSIKDYNTRLLILRPLVGE